MGYLVPYKMEDIQVVAEPAPERRYVRIPPHFLDYETPKGSFVDLRPVLTYAERRWQINPSSSVWAIFYIKWVAKVVVALLWDL